MKKIHHPDRYFPHMNVQMYKQNKENRRKRCGLSWDLHVRSKNSCRAALFSEIDDPSNPEHNVQWFALFLTLKKKKNVICSYFWSFCEINFMERCLNPNQKLLVPLSFHPHGGRPQRWSMYSRSPPILES